MAKKGRSERGMFGTIHHYDEKGRKIGRSEPGIFGGYTNYDAKGKKTGRSEPNLFGGYTNYDSQGKKIGRSDPNAFGGYNHYDSRGKKTGSSDPGLFGGYSNNDSTEGCYIATCVYGSYDCPQVWTLRRFRDNTLSRTYLGRAFIRTYYAASPSIVRWFGNTVWFKKLWRGTLDAMVRRLNAKGVEDAPYEDRHW